MATYSFKIQKAYFALKSEKLWPLNDALKI